MAGGQRIDDHKFFAGGMTKESVLPKGVHTKQYDSDGHSGMVKSYEDTTEMIERQQKMGEGKQKSHDRKELHRN